MASCKRPAGGFSLIEVLVSIVVLSLGLLGMVGMLMTSVRSTSESASFTEAVNLVRELSEKARINKNVATQNTKTNPYLVDLESTGALPGRGGTCVGIDAACDQESLAAWDMEQWVERAGRALPQAHVVVCFDDAVVSDESHDFRYAWTCSDQGSNLVVKLGWVPRIGSKDEMAQREPRIVMQLIPGHAYGDTESDGGSS
jgi:type IV pilus assembly protein PilV